MSHATRISTDTDGHRAVCRCGWESQARVAGHLAEGDGGMHRAQAEAAERTNVQRTPGSARGDRY